MANGNLFTRSDTMLGICQGLGEDLGFNPNWLRIALGIALVWKPEATVGVYLALGLVVLVSRLVFPPRAAATPEVTAVDFPSSSRVSDNDAKALAEVA